MSSMQPVHEPHPGSRLVRNESHPWPVLWQNYAERDIPQTLEYDPSPSELGCKLLIHDWELSAPRTNRDQVRAAEPLDRTATSSTQKDSVPLSHEYHRHKWCCTYLPLGISTMPRMKDSAE